MLKELVQHIGFEEHSFCGTIHPWHTSKAVTTIVQQCDGSNGPLQDLVYQSNHIIDFTTLRISPWRRSLEVATDIVTGSVLARSISFPSS